MTELVCKHETWFLFVNDVGVKRCTSCRGRGRELCARGTGPYLENMEIRALISCFMEDESIQSFHLIYFIKLRRLSAVSHKMMNCVLLFYDFICFLWSVTTMKMKRTRRFLSPVLLWPRAERDFVSWSESLFFLFNKVVVSRDESLLYFHHAHHVRRLIPGLLLRCSQTTDRVKLVWGQFIRELTHSVSSASVSVTNWDDLWADRKEITKYVHSVIFLLTHWQHNGQRSNTDRPLYQR